MKVWPNSSQSLPRHRVVWCLTQDDQVVAGKGWEKRDFFTSFSNLLSLHCCEWLNPSRNLLQVILMSLVNTLLFYQQTVDLLLFCGKKSESGRKNKPVQIRREAKQTDGCICRPVHTAAHCFLVSLVVSHNKQSSHWLWRAGLALAGVLNRLHSAVTYETVKRSRLSERVIISETCSNNQLICLFGHHI